MELLDEEEVAVGIQVANERGEEERASEWAWRGRGAGGAYGLSGTGWRTGSALGGQRHGAAMPLHTAGWSGDARRWSCCSFTTLPFMPAPWPLSAAGGRGSAPTRRMALTATW